MSRTIAILSTVAAVSACCTQQEETIAQQEERIAGLEQEVTEMQASVADHEALSKEVDNLKSKLNATQEILEEVEQREAQHQARLDMVREMLGKFKAMIDAGKLSVHVEQGKMKLELPSAVLFPSGSADLSEKGMETLDEVAEVLKQIEGREFQVAGHTDSKKLGKDNPYETNWHLSVARAVSVVLYLREKGVRPKALSAAGYARFKPVASNKTKKGQARNRRIEITVMPNLEELPDLSDIERELGLESRDEVTEEEAGEAAE